MPDTLTLGEYRNAVRLVVDHGGTLTDEWVRLVARWDRFTALDGRPLDTLTAAVLGDAADALLLASQYAALTAAVTSPVEHALVRNTVAGAVETQLRAEYDKVAEANYLAVAEQFDTAAQTLTTAIRKVNPDATSKDLVKLSKADQAAWADIDVQAQVLNEMLPVLAVASRLARWSRRDDPATLIALSVNADGLHRRRVWEAWEHDVRHGGRWVSLVQLGAAITAHEPGKVTPYREPKPIEHRHVRHDIGWRTVEIDPEDEVA